MATIQKNLEMVNFVCKFGDADLLDLFAEVVYPAFFNEDNKRKYRGSDDVCLKNRRVCIIK